MKKKILVSTSFVALSLVAFGFINWTKCADHENTTCNPSETTKTTFRSIHKKAGADKSPFHYEVSTRFVNRITLHDLRNAKTISDLTPKGATYGMSSFTDVHINILDGDKKLSAEGSDHVLSSAQMELLKNAGYSTNFNIEAFCKHINEKTGKLEKYCFVYYITVIPEKEAEYEKGNKALIQFLKEKSQDIVKNISEDELKPGKISFVVTKSGSIEEIQLDTSSGYVSIDKKMIELMNNLPAQWIPAENESGEKVNQKLVYSFGLIGC